jgi:hypothetical protein
LRGVDIKKRHILNKKRRKKVNAYASYDACACACAFEIPSVLPIALTMTLPWRDFALSEQHSDTNPQPKGNAIKKQIII